MLLSLDYRCIPSKDSNYTNMKDATSIVNRPSRVESWRIKAQEQQKWTRVLAFASLSTSYKTIESSNVVVNHHPAWFHPFLGLLTAKTFQSLQISTTFRKASWTTFLQHCWSNISHHPGISSQSLGAQINLILLPLSPIYLSWLIND